MWVEGRGVVGRGSKVEGCGSRGRGGYEGNRRFSYPNLARMCTKARFISFYFTLYQFHRCMAFFLLKAGYTSRNKSRKTPLWSTPGLQWLTKNMRKALSMTVVVFNLFY